MTTPDTNIHQDSEIDLRDVFRVLWLRKLFILVFVVLTTALTYTLIQKIPNIYSSTVLIMLKSSTKSPDAIQSLLTGSIIASENTETELQLIKSKNILARVAKELDLHNHPAFKPKSITTGSSNKPIKTEDVVKLMLKNLRVLQLRDTDLIAITYESPYPELSAQVANNIGSTFIDYKETLTAGKHRQGARFLSTKIEEVKESLELAEVKIVEYQSTHEFIDIKASVTLATNKLTQLHNKKDALLASIEQLTITKTHIKSNKGNSEVLLLLPAFANTKSIATYQSNIKELRQKFEEVKLRYGYKHPKYIASEEMLSNGEQTLGRLVNDQVSKIETQLAILQEQVQFFESEIEKLTLRLSQLGVIEFDYEKLKKEFDANLELYENLVKKQTESELMQDLTDASNAIMIESATIERTPIKPNRKALLLFSVVSCFLIACTIVLLEFYMSNRVMKFRKVAIRYGTKVIGTVPKLTKSDKGVITGVDENKQIKFIESIRSIRTSILLDKERSKHEIIAITSISPNDGKSTLAFQLSKSFSEVGSTLLIDADLRYPSIAKALKQEVERPGLTNLIVHSHSLKDAILQPSDEKFDVITSGHIPKNPLAFLQHKRFSGLLNVLKSKYQRVLLECPPIMSVSDAFVVSKYVDSVYLVIDSNRAHDDELANVLDELKQAEVEVGGVIINKVKEKRGYGSYSYYNYYGRAVKT